jgi:hypothetical protein
MAKCIASYSKLLALYELEAELRFGASGSYVSDVLGGADFRV